MKLATLQWNLIGVLAMLDFNSDPFIGSDPFKGLGGSDAISQPRQRPTYRKPLPEDESQSLGKQVLGVGTSGISHVLGALDKPGQAARGVLARKGIGSLKHLVPFSDTMGLTTEMDHTSGRDLTNAMGLTERGDKGWGAWGAGLAADIATDPLTYTTFGAKHALTGVGKAVQKTGALKGFTGRHMIEGFHGVEPAMLAAGQTASDVTHAIDQGRKIATGKAVSTGIQANQPLSSLVRIGLPGGPGVNIGTGHTAQRIAGAIDSAGDWMKYGNPEISGPRDPSSSGPPRARDRLVAVVAAWPDLSEAIRDGIGAMVKATSQKEGKR